MFKWQDSFNIGIPEIDKQHRRLFAIGDRIYDTATLNDNCDHYDELVEALNELVEYTEYHFGYEEELMQKYNYPEYATHKIEHDFFVKKLKKIAGKDLDEDQGRTMMEIVHFVADWISGHILDTDVKYKVVMQKNGL